MDIIQDFFSTPTNAEWKVSITLYLATILLAFVIRACISFVLYLTRYFKKDVLPGDWWMYHYSIKNKELIFLKQRLRIKIGFGITYSYRIYLRNIKESHAAYVGNVKIEGPHYIFAFQSNVRNSEETITVRTNRIYERGQDIIGLYTGIHFDGKAYTTLAVIRKTQIPRNDAENFDAMFGHRLKFSTNNLFIELD